MRFSLTGRFRQISLLLVFGLVGALALGGLWGCSFGSSSEGPSSPMPPSEAEARPEDQSVELTWKGSPEADFYRVYRSSSAGTTPSKPKRRTTQTTYGDETAKNGEAYFYVVTAVTTSGRNTAESEPSEEVKAVPFSAPKKLKGSSGPSEVSLTWLEAQGASDYNVYRSLTSISADRPAEKHLLAEDVKENSFRDTTAQNGTLYFYRVTSKNGEGEESQPTGQIKKTPFPEPPSSP